MCVCVCVYVSVAIWAEARFILLLSQRTGARHALEELASMAARAPEVMRHDQVVLHINDPAFLEAAVAACVRPSCASTADGLLCSLASASSAALAAANTCFPEQKIESMRRTTSWFFRSTTPIQINDAYSLARHVGP